MSWQPALWHDLMVITPFGAAIPTGILELSAMGARFQRNLPDSGLKRVSCGTVNVEIDAYVYER